MRIALVDTFPNMEFKAELEFFARFHIAATRLGHESRTVVTSDDVFDYDPDLVVITHDYSAKLWDVPTIGLLWSPLPFFEGDAYRERSVLSYDGYLAGSERTRWYAKDIRTGLGIVKPVGEGIFPPTTCTSQKNAFPRTAPLSLCYVGVNWDGSRHEQLLNDLAGGGDVLNFYGPRSLSHAGNTRYHGRLPFDGESVPAAIAEHGVALCFHTPEHREDDVPSMRLFEALSVGAIVICDRLNFAARHLQDIAYFVDLNEKPAVVAQQIRDILADLNSDLPAAAERAARGKRWFEAGWSLEQKITQALLPLHKQILQEGLFLDDKHPPAILAKPRSWFSRIVSREPEPQVDIVVRTGTREIEFLQRALGSIRAANSPALPLNTIVVDWAGRPDVAELCANETETGLPVRYLRSPRTGWRSTSMWDGFKAATAPLVAPMDDDDTIFANHFRQLAITLARTPEANVSYSGVLRLEEEGSYILAPNFDGKLGRVIPERRELKFLDAYDLARLARYDNYIQSNAWMAKRPFLQSILHDDPEMVICEDMYLLLLMAAGGPMAFTGGATAVWHWRTNSAGNAMLNVPAKDWADGARRVARRLRNVPFVTNLTFAQLSAMEPPATTPSGATSRSLSPINVGTELADGAAVSTSTALFNFHTVERDGAWTRAETAWLEFNPATQLRESGGTLVLRLMTAPLLNDDEGWFEVEIEGGERARRSFRVSDHWTIRLPLGPKGAGNHRLTLRVSKVLQGGVLSADTRDLGLYLRSFAIEPAES